MLARGCRDAAVAESRQLRAEERIALGTWLARHARCSATIEGRRNGQTERRMDDVTRKRLEHNEQVFRAVNEEIDDASGGAAREYVCECADAACTQTIRLTEEGYQAVRADPKRYVVIPGHEVAGLERVVDREPDHLLVEKN
jgi:hypothetical protein